MDSMKAVPSWEYKTIKAHTMNGIFSEQTLTNMLNEQGRDGWELVSAIPVCSMGYDVIMFFKRPKA